MVSLRYALAAVALLTVTTSGYGAQWVEVDAGKLTTHFSQTPLNVGLKALSEATGVKFLLDEQLSGTLDANVKGIPPQAAIRRLISSYNHAVFYRADADGRPLIAKVKLFRAGAEQSARYSEISAGEAPVNSGGASAGNEASSAPVETAAASTAAEGDVAAQAEAAGPVRAAAAPGEAYREVGRQQRRVSLMIHKMLGSERALNAEIAKVRRSLSSGQGNPAADLEKLNELEGQLVKNKQANSQRLLSAQQALQDDVDQLAAVQSPADKLRIQQQLMSRSSRGASDSSILESESGDRETRLARHGI